MADRWLRCACLCVWLAGAREQANAALHCPWPTLLHTDDDGLPPLETLPTEAEPWAEDVAGRGLEKIARMAGMDRDVLVAGSHVRHPLPPCSCGGCIATLWWPHS